MISEPAGIAPATERSQGEKSIAFGLLKRRTVFLPTWRAIVVVAGIALVLGSVALRAVHPFLAHNDSRPGEVLVVEGWATDYAIEEAVAEYKRGGYRDLYVTGGPIEKGAPLSEFGTIADVGAETIRRLHPDLHVTAVSSPDVQQDRTYASAVALRDYLAGKNANPKRLNLVSMGPHSRRSHMLFQAAFGKNVDVGVIAVPDRSYDSEHWWASSMGFRSVTGELIAYAYAKLLFRPN